jgi:DNA-binding HxlR family transcriptional regulator
MVKRTRKPRRSSCPIATSLDIFGDRWSLLIIRDLLFTDHRRFSDFARADEEIATNVLTDRLELLECEGLIRRRPDPADGRKFVYDLTRKGFELAPVIVEMVIWAARHEKTAAPPVLVREMERDREKFVEGLRARWERSSALTDRPFPLA